MLFGHIEQFPRDFCFESQGCFVFGNEAQRHATKGAQQIAEHRLDFPEFSGKSLTSRDSKSRFITQTTHTNVVGLFCDAGYRSKAVRIIDETLF